MGSQLSTGFVHAIRDGDPFVPIPVAALRLDSVTGFDLYIELGPGEPPILYARRNVPFTEAALKRLQDSHVKHLFVDASDESSFRHYLERHLPSILTDPTMELEPKADLLYVSAQGLVREILQNPQLERGVARGKLVVESTVEFLLSQPGALRHLIHTASRDYFAYTHSVNACVYGVALVQKTAGPRIQLLKDFGGGAIFRDLGMTQLDRSITESPGALTLDQFEIIKQHPVLGEDMLAAQGDLDEFALDVVRHHHEKMDGSGYPDHIGGSEISPFVRACTIADVFDALTTNRAHRKALSTFDALRFMRTKMEKQLEDDALRAFVEIMGNPIL